MAQLGDTIVQGDLRVTGEVHGKTICYVTTSSSWNDLDAAYKVGKTLILRVENGTNFFDEYRLSSVNQSTGSNRFIFCGFPTITSVTSGTINSLKVNGYICYIDGSTTKWVASGFNNADLTTKAYVDGRTPSVIGAVPTSRTVNSKALSADITLSASDVGAVPTSRTVNSKALSSNITLSASDVGAVTQMSTAQLGSPTSFSSAKTNYLTLPNSTIAFQYNTNGAEETLLYSSGTATASWGNILRWGNSSNYMYIGHITKGQGVSPSTDWEKISAGYADNAGTVSGHGAFDPGTTDTGVYDYGTITPSETDTMIDYGSAPIKRLALVYLYIKNTISSGTCNFYIRLRQNSQTLFSQVFNLAGNQLAVVPLAMKTDTYQGEIWIQRYGTNNVTALKIQGIWVNFRY